MVRERRASESPLVHLAKLNEQSDRKHEQRALSLNEVRRLLRVTACQEECYGMSGAARALLYRLAIETGLRANELRNLTSREL